MVDLRSILSEHNSKGRPLDMIGHGRERFIKATTSEIPDIFFDEVLVDFKLTRIEICVLMYLYRQVWCRPNLYKKFGIGPIISHSDLSETLKIEIDSLYNAIQNLERFGCLETVRAGQYFVRKFFTEDFDKKYGQTYDNFF